MSTASEARMPIIFFGHGSPMNTLAGNRYTKAWRSLGASVPAPKASSVAATRSVLVRVPFSLRSRCFV
jgi:aromatic ring-opening dioxygenase catalytic subunit (LigB family)